MLIAVAVLGVACPKKDGGAPSGSVSPGAVVPTSTETPPFDFTVDRITPYTAAPGKLPKGIPPEVQKASDDIAKQMSALYKAAYLDPANWQNGNYDSYFAAFESKAAATAKGQVDDLTAGTAAGDQFTDIQPGFAHLNTKVMLDEKGKPLIGVAVIDFNATATGTDSAQTNLRSTGQFFMRPKGNGWEIFAYSVNRQDGGDIPAIPTPGAKPEKKNDKPMTDEATGIPVGNV